MLTNPEYIWVVHSLGSKDSGYCSIGHKNALVWERLVRVVQGQEETKEQGGEAIDALSHENKISIFRK